MSQDVKKPTSIKKVTGESTGLDQKKLSVASFKNPVIGPALYLAGNDIDTDRIIPARFMKCVTFDELGQYAFYDLRYDNQGRLTDSVLNQSTTASILITDNNFGCGSSREHAPQALLRNGVKAIVAGSFAEIFFGNCTTLGIPCVTLDSQKRQSLIDWLKEDPLGQIEIDLTQLELSFSNQIDLRDKSKNTAKVLAIKLKESARRSLIENSYDPLQKLLSASELTIAKAKQLGYAKSEEL